MELLLRLLKKPAFWLILVFVALTITCTILAAKLSKNKQEVARLENNQSALLMDVEKYRSENGELVASVQALTLQKEELETLMPKYAEEIESLRIKLSDVTAVVHAYTEMNVSATVPITGESVPETGESVPETDESVPENRDSVPNPENNEPLPREFLWTDRWTEISGKIYADSLSCTVISRDSLTIVAHYKKKKCLFRKKGKLKRYELRSKNPHVTIDGFEVMELLDE